MRSSRPTGIGPCRPHRHATGRVRERGAAGTTLFALIGPTPVGALSPGSVASPYRTSKTVTTSSKRLTFAPGAGSNTRSRPASHSASVVLGIILAGNGSIPSLGQRADPDNTARNLNNRINTKAWSFDYDHAQLFRPTRPPEPSKASAAASSTKGPQPEDLGRSLDTQTLDHGDRQGASKDRHRSIARSIPTS